MKRLFLVIGLSASLFGATPPVKEITTMKEYNELSKENRPVVFFFYAPWCGACKGMKSPYDEISHELKDKALMVKINVDNKELKPLVQSLGITAIPTIFIKKVGAQKKEALKKIIEAAIG